MSDKLAAALGPDTETVRTDLQRRRELASMIKPELISMIIDRENDLYDLARSVEHAYGDQP